MFRLTRAHRRDSIYLTLEGELRSDSVGTAESACLEALADGAPVTVLVKNVTEIDEDGDAFLRRLVATKAKGHADSSPFFSALNAFFAPVLHLTDL